MNVVGRSLLAVTNRSTVRKLFAESSTGRRLSLRFVAGETLDEAAAAARKLNEAGAQVSLDHLGEHVSDTDAAAEARDDYLECLDRIHADRLDANISVKLTQLGLGLDDDLAADSLRALAARAAEGGTTVTVDMEESELVERTVTAFEAVRSEYGNVGIAVQSYLYRTPADLDRGWEEVTFTGEDGLALNGWYVPAPEARFTVLFCHGNGGNIMHRLDAVSLLHGLGLSCFIFDYRGYGTSQGKPTEVGTYRDARAAYDWLTLTRRVPPEQIIILGRSLGGSVAAHLAGQVEVRGLAIEGAFTSFPDIGAKFYPYMPVRLFARYKYDTRANLAEVHCPVLVIHSRDDELVPFEFGEQLFRAANEPKQFVELLGGHNDGFLVSGDLYKDAWRRWLDFEAGYQAQDTVHHIL